MTESASFKRDKPLFISDHCECGTKLVLFDLWYDPPTTNEEEIWYDEWICPSCIKTNLKDGIRWDWSQEHREEVENLIGKPLKLQRKKEN